MSTGMTVGDLRVLGSGEAVWESSPQDGTWIDFPGNRTYFFGLPEYFQPTEPPIAYIASVSAPTTDAAPGSYTLASGQLAEFGPFVNGGFLVGNGTCQEYYLYVSVRGTYAPPPEADGGAASLDASDERPSGAGAPDAGPDG